MSGPLSTFCQNNEEEAAVSTTTRTGLNKGAERSSILVFWNNGCFHESAGRAVNMGYIEHDPGQQRLIAEKEQKHILLGDFVLKEHIHYCLFSSCTLVLRIDNVKKDG